MRLSRQTALALAILLGCFAVLLAYAYLRNKQPPEQIVEKIQLPVPIADIPAHADLRRDMFHERFFDADKIPRDAVTDPGRLQGRVTLSELAANEPVPASAVAVRSAALGLAYAIPTQCRAVTIPVDDVSGVANLVRNGDRVDVLAIFNDDSGRMSTVQTVLQDLEVLAVHGIAESSQSTEGEDGASEGDKPAARRGEGSKTVTVAVTPHQAQILLLSKHRGLLTLMLRRTGDRDIVALGRSQSWSLIGTFPSIKEPEPESAQPEQRPAQGYWPEMWGGPPMTAATGAAPPAAPAAPKEPAVEVIRGSNREFISPIN